uniref:Ral GTPase-activating protein subunit beta n=1 Tax=Lygus hesperus TaxID=30085 RepID=A0A0A9XJX0_LYGHE
MVLLPQRQRREYSVLGTLKDVFSGVSNTAKEKVNSKVESLTDTTSQNVDAAKAKAFIEMRDRHLSIPNYTLEIFLQTNEVRNVHTHPLRTLRRLQPPTAHATGNLREDVLVEREICSNI